MFNHQIRVVVADDMEAQRRRLERYLTSQPDILLVEMASSGQEAVEIAMRENPNVVLMDVEMEDKWAGITASKRINNINPTIKIIILTVHDDNSAVIAAFQTGIVDYILKTATTDEIGRAIRDAHRNLSPIRPIIAQKIREELQKSKERETQILATVHMLSKLTPSEIEIVQLLHKGLGRSEIAAARFVAPETIKKQLNSILKKTGFRRSKDLIHTLVDQGITDILERL